MMICRNQELLDNIVKDIKENGKITERELANKYYYDVRTIRRYIKLLKDNKIIRLNARGKNRHWIIID